MLIAAPAEVDAALRVPARETAPMPSDAAELSSLVSALSDVDDRLRAIAGRYEGTTRDDLLAALYEAERNLRAVIRSVERAAQLAP